MLAITSTPASAAVGCAATPATPNTAHFRGIAGPASTRASCASELGGGGGGASPSNNGTPPLIYHGGPVMATPSAGNQVVVTPIFWAPTGYSFTSSYETVIETYLQDLAADSDKTTNVFGTTYQYTQGTAPNTVPVNYRMVAGTPITTNAAFPTAGCTTDTGAIYGDNSGYSTCLDDQQVESELDSVVAAHGLTRDLGHLYVMLLPKGVESCFYPAGTANQECTLNYTASAAYCAYHSGFYGSLGSGEVIYANMPFPIYNSPVGYTCGSQGGLPGTEAPNGDADADTEISPLSHEMAESMTDPNGNAWYDSTGNENGDDCAYIYGATSGVAGALYNQTVNGHHYLTQEEFSNADYAISKSDGCQQSSVPVVPTVTGVSPGSGPTAGGGTVTITGTGFPGATKVWFGSTSASFTIVNPTTITATAPAGGAGAEDVTVATTAGTSATSAADEYTYPPPPPPAPSVAGVGPMSGTTDGGTSVTITGSHLTGATAVSFGSTPATTFSVTDDGHIAATAPAGTGTVDVTVTTPAGTSATSAADQFTYTVAQPAVTGLSPGSGPAAGGTSVTVTGTDLSGATAVSFGSTPATTFSVTDSGHLTATAPAGTGTVDVTVTTPAGTSATSAPDRFTYTVARPTVTGISPSTGPTAGGTSVTITGTNLTGATAVRFGTRAATAVVVVDAGHVRATAPAGVAGTVDVTVTTPGGTSAVSAGDRFKYASKPKVRLLSVHAGSHAGGTRVVITGTGFAPGSVVHFGTKRGLRVVVSSSTRIVVRTPAHTRGKVNVTVTTPGGTSSAVRSDRYTFS